MAKYRTLTKSFINNAIVEAGELVEYDGVPGSNLELVEGEAPKAAPKTKAKGPAKVAAPAAPATPEAGSDAGADLV
jgi:hypothetical protein